MKQDERKPEETVLLNGIPYAGGGRFTSEDKRTGAGAGNG